MENQNKSKQQIRIFIVSFAMMIALLIALMTILQTKNKEVEILKRSVQQQAEEINKKEVNLLKTKISTSNKMYDLCEEVFKINDKIENGTIQKSLDAIVNELYRINNENLKVSVELKDINIDTTSSAYRDIQDLKYLNESISGSINKMIRGVRESDLDAFKEGAASLRDIQSQLTKYTTGGNTNTN